MRFYDRENEINILKQNELQAQTSATFTVLMGRRRVGKTSLLTHTLSNSEYAYLFVSKDSESLLCRKFQSIISEQLGISIYGNIVKFGELFEIVMRESQKRHFTIVFDEFQTLYKINPAIFSEIQDIWDRYHRESRINLIVSGSIQSLMKRIFEEKGEPLYGRPTSKFTLLPFSIEVLKESLQDHHPYYVNEDLLCLYMITGGVAKYVELLMDAKCTSKKRMLDYVCRPDSYFLTEGRDIMNQEFSDDSATYFSILQLIAQGMTRRTEIDSVMQKDMGVYLMNMEKNFYMVTRKKPILSRANSKTTSYAISDPFLRFWFRFICPYQSLIERQQTALLRQNIEKNYELFSGITLEQYFQTMYMETGQYTAIGNWWDRKNENEIDMVAINEIDHTGLIAEIKRNPKKISLGTLYSKIENLPKAEFGKYKFEVKGLSMEDM
ncbi:MAG: ATP-binding protein [Bacteroidales bacterium]|nr:ATP-binding protein [Bacteroidales bacterium]